MTAEIVLNFDPHVLPTAQHRAGLAGLLIGIKSLERRGREPRPEVTVDRHGTVELGLTEESLQTLFDCLYAATSETVWVPKVRTNRKTGQPVEPLDRRERVEEKTGGKPKVIEEYAYPQVVPAGLPLQDLGMPAHWLKLWRDIIWNVLRAIPTTRGPYEARAVGKPAKDAVEAWKAIIRGVTGDVKGHMYLGAQEATADAVPFRGQASENLLLHFWPLVMGLGLGVALKIDNGQVKQEQTGYVITIPDVHDLEWFREDFAAATAQLDDQAHPYFKERPRSSVLALPQEGGLDYVARLSAVAKARAAGSSVAMSLSGTEVYCMKTGGQQPRLASVGRLSVTRDVLERYESASRSRQTPTFRRQLILNVLDRVPWYRAFNRLFDDLPDAFFVGSGQWFGADATSMFEQQVHAAGGMVSTTTSSNQTEFDLARRVRDMVRAYVRHRTEERSGITWESFKDDRQPTASGGMRVNTPTKYSEAQERVCTDAFFQLRATRSREDFIAYFTGTICSVPQFLPEAEYQGIAVALLRRDDTWEDIKSLSMLAISALSGS